MNLSIFNFDPLKRALALPLKRHGWHLLVVGVGISMLALASVAMGPAREAKESLAPSREALNSARLLLLGNSQYQHLRPDWFSAPLVNLSIAGNNFVVKRAFLEHFGPRTPQLQAVLLGLDSVPLRVNTMENRGGDFRDLVGMGLPWYKLPEQGLGDALAFRIAYDPWLRPLLVGPKWDMDWLLDTWLLPSAQARSGDFPPPEAGFDPDTARPPFFSPPSGGERKMDHYARRLSGDTETYRENRAALFAMAEWCAGRQVDLVLLRIPTEQAFWRNRPVAWEEELAEVVNSLRATFPQLRLHLLDDDQHNEYPVHLFLDPNHLSLAGLRHYSEGLDRALCSALADLCP